MSDSTALAETKPKASRIDGDIRFISLWAEGVGPVHYDVLENCASLDVTPADFYGSGREMSTRFGLIAVPCKWRFDHSRHTCRTS